MVVAGTTDVRVHQRQLAGRGRRRRRVASALVVGIRLPVKPVLEDRLHAGVGAGADLQAAGAGRLDAVSTIAAQQAQDAEAGTEALLGMGPALQDHRGQRRLTAPDPPLRQPTQGIFSRHSWRVLQRRRHRRPHPPPPLSARRSPRTAVDPPGGSAAWSATDGSPSRGRTHTSGCSRSHWYGWPIFLPKQQQGHPRTSQLLVGHRPIRLCLVPAARFGTPLRREKQRLQAAVRQRRWQWPVGPAAIAHARRSCTVLCATPTATSIARSRRHIHVSTAGSHAHVASTLSRPAPVLHLTLTKWQTLTCPPVGQHHPSQGWPTSNPNSRFHLGIVGRHQMGIPGRHPPEYANREAARRQPADREL